MSVHELKTIRPWFRDVWDGTKTAELRRDDRDYAVGDVLLLREWHNDTYTGRQVAVEVTNIVLWSDGPWLRRGYAMLSFRLLPADVDIASLPPDGRAHDGS